MIAVTILLAPHAGRAEHIPELVSKLGIHGTLECKNVSHFEEVGDDGNFSTKEFLRWSGNVGWRERPRNTTDAAVSAASGRVE